MPRRLGRPEVFDQRHRWCWRCDCWHKLSVFDYTGRFYCDEPVKQPSIAGCKVAARRRIGRLVKHGKIPPARAFACCYRGCAEQARQFHHFAGYEGLAALALTPLCLKHHRVLDRIQRRQEKRRRPRRRQ
jgi:hypothetical protein